MNEWTRALLARTDLTSAAKVLLLVLVDRADEQGQIAATLTELSAASGHSDRTLRRTMQDLADLSLIAVLARPGYPSVIQLQGPANPTGPGTPVMLAGPTPVILAAPPVILAGPPAKVAGPPVILAAPLTRAREESNYNSNPSENNSSPLLVEGESAERGRPRRTPKLLPDDWQPNIKTLGICANHYPAVDLSRELVLFRRYWIDGNGAGTKRADWDGTFLNWMAKARPGAAAPGGARAASPSGPKPSEGMAYLLNLMGRGKRYG